MRRTGDAPAGRKRVSRKPDAASPRQQAPREPDELARVRAVLDDMKAENVVVIPLAGQASFADFLVIASGTSSRHVSSMGQALDRALGKAVLGMEGLQDGEWVCADMGDIVVHLFVPDKRELYNLEKLWSHIFTDGFTDGPA